MLPFIEAHNIACHSFAHLCPRLLFFLELKLPMEEEDFAPCLYSPDGIDLPGSINQFFGEFGI